MGESEQATRPRTPIESLARELGLSDRDAAGLYEEELARLDAVARVKTFLPLLVEKKVRIAVLSRRRTESASA